MRMFETVPNLDPAVSFVLRFNVGSCMLAKVYTMGLIAEGAGLVDRTRGKVWTVLRILCRKSATFRVNVV
jgi:hypothetical protein